MVFSGIHDNWRSVLLVNDLLSIYTQLLSWDIIRRNSLVCVETKLSLEFQLIPAPSYFMWFFSLKLLQWDVSFVLQTCHRVCGWYNLRLYLPWLAPAMSQNLRHSFYKVWFTPIIPVIRTQVNDLHCVKNNMLKEITDPPSISSNLGSFCNMQVHQNCI
jgi:hypothetical protein